MNPSYKTTVSSYRLPGWTLYALAALFSLLGTLAAAQEPDSKLTTPERIARFNQSTPQQRIALIKGLVPPEDAKDFERFKIPDFLIKVLKDTNEDPRVRDAALQGMVLAIQKIDANLRGQFIPAFLDVLSEKQVGLVQEYVMIASPTAVDAEGPGPNKLLLNKIAAIAQDSKMTDDNELRLRVQSIIALGKIGNKDYLEIYFKMMADPNKEIVRAAIEAVKEFLRSKDAGKLELTTNQVSVLTALLKNKDTSFDSKAALLRTLGVNARGFRASHPANQTAPGSLEVMMEIKAILDPPAGTELPPFYMVGACIETLGMYGQKEAVDLIKRIFKWKYLKTPEGQPYRVKAVDVVDQVIGANIGDGKSCVPVVEDIATLLVELLADETEDGNVRNAAAFYLADVRYPCYKRDVYFNELFIHAYADPATPGFKVDEGLATTCKKSMEVLAGRTFPADWTFNDFNTWWNKVGKAELAKK